MARPCEGIPAGSAPTRPLLESESRRRQTRSRGTTPSPGRETADSPSTARSPPIPLLADAPSRPPPRLTRAHTATSCGLTNTPPRRAAPRVGPPRAASLESRGGDALLRPPSTPAPPPGRSAPSGPPAPAPATLRAARIAVAAARRRLWLLSETIAGAWSGSYGFVFGFGFWFWFGFLWEVGGTGSGVYR